MTTWTDEQRQNLMPLIDSIERTNGIPERMAAMTSEQIGELLFETLYADTAVYTATSYLVEEAARRLGFDVDKAIKVAEESEAAE